MKRALPLALLLVAGGALAAAPPTTRQLLNSQWQVTRINGKVPVSPRARIRFDRTRIAASVGCNGLGGNWRIESGRLIGGPFVSTMMFCEGVMEQERAMADLLGSRPSVSIDRNVLRLNGGGHRLEARRVPAPNPL